MVARKEGLQGYEQRNGEEPMSKKQRKNERGYTLLEYCAGAAIIASILWTALNSLGGDLSALLGAVGGWANAREGQVIQN